MQENSCNWVHRNTIYTDKGKGVKSKKASKFLDLKFLSFFFSNMLIVS